MLLEPKYSVDLRQHEVWEGDWVTQRFSAALECSNSQCGEFSIVVGDTEAIEDADEEHGWYFYYKLRPRAFFPAPPIIALPESVPTKVEKELEVSFALFWSDLGAAASRIRTALERILDDKGIKKFGQDKRTGKRVHLALASRIQLFNSKYGEDQTAVMSALRQLGNVGTHSETTRTAVLAAYELIDFTLSEIYEKRKIKIARLAKTVAKKKGKLK